MIHIPAPEDFGGDFLADNGDLKETARKIIDRRLRHLDDGELLIDYAWKMKGGKSGGNAVLGKCVKLSGPAKHYANGAHFFVWLAADHCDARDFDDRAIEALLYHELLHITRAEKIDEETEEMVVVYGTRGHDFEGFVEEIKVYGAWDASARQMAFAFAEAGKSF